MIDKTEYEVRKVAITLEGRLIYCNNLMAFDDIDYTTFSDVIEDIRKTCINIGRADIATILRHEVEEYTDSRFDEYDSYICEYTILKFRDDDVFEVTSGDYDLYNNTEYEDLIEFINKDVLLWTDMRIELKIKELVEC